MDLKNIEKIMKLMDSYDVGSFNYEDKLVKVKLQKRRDEPAVQVVQEKAMVPVAVQQAPVVAEKLGKQITTPFVGTFYTAPAPDQEPYVKVGDKVKKGDILCIVEAMKLMNEIECESTGVIQEICVENGQAVEFGQALFIIT